MRRLVRWWRGERARRRWLRSTRHLTVAQRSRLVEEYIDELGRGGDE